jgi:predicted Zn-dependent protease
MSYYDDRREYREAYTRRRRRPTGLGLRLLIALVIVAVSVIGFYFRTDVNPVTGETQRVALSVEEEIRMGLAAAPEMISMHGGPSRDADAVQRLEMLGFRLISALQNLVNHRNADIPYQFDFHLLADPHTVNAFALPGGQIFITQGLYNRLPNDSQLAGVLAHEIGHVIERHSAEQLAKRGLTQGLAGAAGVFGGDINSMRMAQLVGEFTMMKYSRDDERESDGWGVLLTTLAGYDPRAMLDVMDVLARASPGQTPEIFSTHPPPENRKENILRKIEEYFPDGLPPGLAR